MISSKINNIKTQSIYKLRTKCDDTWGAHTSLLVQVINTILTYNKKTITIQ